MRTFNGTSTRWDFTLWVTVAQHVTVGRGALAGRITEVIQEQDLTCAAALSGNRNFEGRINPHCRANYIMSPPLVVAYAIAGSMLHDLEQKPLGQNIDGKDVYFAGYLANR